MIQSCCHMPPFVISLSQFLMTPKSYLTSQAASNLLDGENNVPEFHAVPDLTVQTSAVSVFNQEPPATVAEAKVKILCGDWSFHLGVKK